MVLGIICTLPLEAEPLVRGTAMTGRVYSVGPKAFLAVSGSGRSNADKAAGCLLERGVDALICWGFAYALQPGLSAGDVVLAEQLVTDRVTYPVSRSWRRAMRKRLADFTRVYDGALAHSDHPLARPGDKHLLHDSSRAIAFDCESAAVAARAKKTGVPFLALKVISDVVGIRLPAAKIEAAPSADQAGLGQRLARVGARPWEWPARVRKAWCSKQGLEKLKYMALKLDRDLAPPERVERSSAGKA